MGALAISAGLFADDATGIGIADDPLIPVVLVGGAVISSAVYITQYVRGKEKILPSWVNDRPRPGQSGKDFAKEQCDKKYPNGYDTGPGSDYNKIKKWTDRRK